MTAYTVSTDLPNADFIVTQLYPLTLSGLVSSTSFQPPPSFSTSPTDENAYSVVAHSLARQMLEAVRYLHETGIAHRDIGTDNFVLERSGRVVLIDFGLAIPEHVEQMGSMYFEVGTGYTLSASTGERWN